MPASLLRLPPATTRLASLARSSLTRVAASSTSIAIALSRAFALSRVPFRALGARSAPPTPSAVSSPSRPRRARRRASLTDRRVRLRDARRRRHGRRRRRRRRRGRARHRRGRRERRALRRELPAQSEFNLSSRLALAQASHSARGARFPRARRGARHRRVRDREGATSSPSRWDPFGFGCRWMDQNRARARYRARTAPREESLEAIARRPRSPFASPRVETRRVEVSREDNAKRHSSPRAQIHLSTRANPSLDPFARGDDARRSTCACATRCRSKPRSPSAPDARKVR